MFEPLLAVSCVCILVALILYIFYWNRFVAFLIAQVIRILYWNQEASSIWVEIGSIHFSLISGRILLKDVQYHSSNQTIRIVKTQIQWRYWIRRPTSEEDIHSRGPDGKHAGRLWSCRIQLSFQGMEWFLYNRTAAYDSIIAQMEKSNRPLSRSSSHRRFFNRFSRQEASSPYPPSSSRPPLRIPAFVTNGLAWFRRQLPSLDPKDLLPLGIDVQTGAIIMGNSSTPDLLVAEFQHAFGTYGIVPSRSKYDLHKQVLNLRFQNPLIRLVDNDDYIDPMAVLGGLVHSRAKHHSPGQKPSFYQSYRSFIRLWRQLGLYRLTSDYITSRRAQRLQHKSLSSSMPVYKKGKAVEEDTPLGIDFSTYEYAVERKILEAPALELTYYVDVVGDVPSEPVSPPFSGNGLPDVGNGDMGPEWGIDLVIFGGFLRYGPWADRQRAELQRAFFPPTYQDGEVTSELKPGDKRLWTALQIFVELREETSLYIPFREPSKDWQWDGVADIPQRPRKREQAFFNVTVGDRSSLNYVMPMVASPTGYESTLEVHLDTIAITSSLNDIRLITAESTRIRCELPAPIKWDSERTWSIAVYLRQPILFMLRDHINMFTDLARDWVTGPPTDYHKFIPMIYNFQLEMHHFEMNLYVNDQNIIDKPMIREENALLSLRGPHLKNVTTIPSNTFRPESTSIPFTLSVPDVVGNFSLPRWSTHALHAGKEGINLFTTKYFTIGGSYRYYAEVQEENIEQLKLDIDLGDPLYRAFGWSIRYFMVLRDNYLGSFTHFQTLYEYLDTRKRNLPIGDPLKLKYRPGQSNMLQVEILLRAERAKLLLPTSLVGSTSVKADDPDTIHKFVTLLVPEMQMQFRMHDYYMEMTLNMDRITGSIQSKTSVRGSTSDSKPRQVLVIDGLDIVANRLFGPQPRTATYVCIWEIAVGNVKASMNASEATILAAASDAFRLNFVDLVNAPADDYTPPIDPDVTFYKVTVKTIEMTWRAGHAAVLVKLDQGIKVDTNDLGAHHYKKVTALKIPRICAKILLSASLDRNNWLEAAEVIADTYLDIYSAPKGHRSLTRAQLTFIDEQDKPTGRAKRLFDQLKHRDRVESQTQRNHHRNGVYLPQPMLPRRTQGRPKSMHGQQPRSYRMRSPSWRVSTLANLSDSEGEEGVSEADRDARLARTRTSTPVPRTVAEEDVTMTSGDESDDADLTDGDSSGDDWSDAGDSLREQISLMSFYSPIMRHFSAHCSPCSTTSEQPFFVLTRECAPFIRHDANDKMPPVVDAHAALPEDIPTGVDVTTFRLRCERTLSIMFTPLLLPASLHLRDDVKAISSDPEMCIDSLLGGCISKLSANESRGCSTVDMSLPRLRLQAVQHIGMDDGHPRFSKATDLPPTPTSLDVVSIVDTRASGIHLSGIFGQNLPTFKSTIDHISASLNVSEDKRTLNQSAPHSTILELSLASSSIHLAQRSFLMTLGSPSIEVGHQGPAWTITTSIALAANASQFLEVAKDLEDHQLTSQRTIIDVILANSEQKPVVDPLSTIQPSYLVQTGIPHLLRNDVSFRFLYHLRNCLRTASDRGSNDEKPFRDLNLAGLRSSVETRLTMLDPDASSIQELISMDHIFYERRERPSLKSSKVKSRLMDAVVLHIAKTRIAIIPPSGQSSELTVSDLRFTAQFKKQDLVLFNFNSQSNASQTSLRSKSSKPVRNTAIIASFGDISLIVAPLLMEFAQHLLRMKKQLASGWDQAPESERVPIASSGMRRTELVCIINRLRIQAAAENLVIVMGLNGLQASSTLLDMQNKALSTNSSFLFDEIYLQARSTMNSTRTSDQDILAAMTFGNGRSNVLSKSEVGSRTSLKVVFTLTSFNLNVPRSALRLYRFVEEWRADYLPGIEATINALLSEYKAAPKRPHSPTSSWRARRGLVIQIHSQIEHFEITLQVMHGTWLSWEMDKTVAYAHNLGDTSLNPPYSFGLQVGSMVLRISSNATAKDVNRSSRVNLTLPPLSIEGHSNGTFVSMLVLLEFLDLKVKPSHWDTVLAVQQKFGQDFNDLVALVQKTRQKPVVLPKPAPKKRLTLVYDAYLKWQGFRIGLEGASSTVYLDCQDINGRFASTNGGSWDVELSGLALSLAPRISGRQNTTFNRNHRSAFVIIDFKMNGSTQNFPQLEKNLRLSVTKIHAVMQPSSIGEFGDFIDNLQAEMLERQEQRALGLAAFKEKTQSILRTFDVNVGDVQLENTSWINDLNITISMRNIGVAFPLTHDEELQLPRSKAKDSIPVRAFLFSIRSIEFATHRGETGQATMQHLAFQFVARFRQSSSEDFAAEKHQTLNCLLYPDMRAQLRTESVGASRKIWIKADVSGFILDIDSTIPSYLFSLIDVYRQGKDRVERLASSAPRTPLSSLPIVENTKPSLDKHYSAVPTSNIFAQLTFLSGKVRFYSGSASGQSRNKCPSSSNNVLDISDDHILSIGAEVFNLPVVSVWGEYRATPASQKLSIESEQEPSLLSFNSTVFSSQNTLRPTLLPFLTELVSQIETRMRKVSSRFAPPPTSGFTPMTPGAPSLEKLDRADSVSSMQICFSLRIDKSKLELTCQPDVNVIAGLHWESGGFVVNVSPGARKVSFSGSIGGLNIGLKHGFLSEDCVRLDARNLAFSVSFTKAEVGPNEYMNTVSVVLDTEFLGGVRFSRLQDILCFKAVWLDRIPLFNNNPENEPQSPVQPIVPGAVDDTLDRGFSTVLLLRIRQIALEVDLGQSITRVNLELNDTVFRTRLTDELSEFSASVADVSVAAHGNISGYAHVPSCVFQTIRRSESALWEDNGKDRMLELKLTSGVLVLNLESDHQRLLYYRAEPLEVEIVDDWSRTHARIDDATRPLQLSFTIACVEVIAVATVGTIPKLLSYINRFKANLDTQRHGASRESQTFRITRTPKPDNPLSAVAEAMLQSARSRFKESGISYVIRQHMSLRLDLLRLIVFPRTMKDVEIAQFIGRDVRARLDGLAISNSVSTSRDLHLSFSSMVISKFNQGSQHYHTLPSLEQPDDDQDREWLEAFFKDASEAIIVGLPSMTMHMISEEAIEDSTRTLTYDFFSEFVRREGMKAFEDIYITLNMSLYSWLTLLRKNLTREMDQVRATEDWRTSMNTVSTAITSGSQRKKKVPDPLNLTESPRSATLPSPGLSTTTLSPFGPSSARVGWMEQSRSPPPSARDSLSPTYQPSSPSPLQFPSRDMTDEPVVSQPPPKRQTVVYKPRNRKIERLTMRQLGEATPDVMHPFFMKKAGFNLEDSLPQYVNEYATAPLEEIMEVLMKLYSRQLLAGHQTSRNPETF